MEMQENGYMDAKNFNKWMTFFSIIMKVKRIYHLLKEFYSFWMAIRVMYP